MEFDRTKVKYGDLFSVPETINNFYICTRNKLTNYGCRRIGEVSKGLDILESIQDGDKIINCGLILYKSQIFEDE